MGSKTISIGDDTYHRLSERKGPDESFTDVINRLLEADSGSHPLADLVGLVDEEQLEAIRRRSTAFRNSMDARFEERAE